MSQNKSPRRPPPFRRSSRKTRFVALALLLGAMVYILDNGPALRAATAPVRCLDLSFVVGTRSAIIGNARAIAVGDFNNDDKPDVVGAQLNGGLVLRLGDGLGGLTAVEDLDFTSDAIELVAADFNEDGNLDLAAAFSGEQQPDGFGFIEVVLGNGQGEFSPPVGYRAGIDTDGVAAGDFNNDGNLDLAAENDDSGDVSLFIGNGLGGFSPAVSVPVGPDAFKIAVGDFNKDNNQDMAVLLGGETDLVAVLLGNGAGGFSAPTTFGIGASPSGLAVADFNKDGNLDLAAANRDDQTVSVILGDGLGAFGPRSFFSVGENPSSAMSGDFNGDGNPDLVIRLIDFENDNDTVSVFLGDGLGAFTPGADVPLGASIETLAIADLNLDGKLDLVASLGGVNDALVPLLNTCTQNLNSPPTVSGATLSRTQGSPAAVSQIGVIGDTEQTPETLSFTVMPLAGSGVTIGNASIDATGNVTASVEAACSATTSTFELKATDAEEETATSILTVNVASNPLPTLSYTNKTLGVGKTATFFPSSGPSDNGNVNSLVLQTVAPETGLELSLNSTNGVITVTSASVAGTYIVEVVATDNCGAQRIASFNITVTCPTTSLSTLANGQAGVAYNRTIAVTPAGSYTFGITSGALPPGLTLNEMTGAVTGTPTATGTYNFTVKATATSGCSATRSYTLVISCPAVAITPTTLPAATLGVGYSQMLSVTPAGSYAFAINFGSLPPGMMLNAMTGELSGVPTLKGSYYITVRAGGFGTCSGVRSYLLAVQ